MEKMEMVNTDSYRKLSLILEEFIALLKSEDTSLSPTTKSIHAHVWSSLFPDSATLTQIYSLVVNISCCSNEATEIHLPFPSSMVLDT